MPGCCLVHLGSTKRKVFVFAHAPPCGQYGPMCVSLIGDGVRLARMTETPTLHLTVGLPGVGKTTLARKIAHEDGDFADEQE